jgi:hypothetical protein
VNADELEEICSALREVLQSHKGEVPLVARALRWASDHARTLGELRLCIAVTSWTLASGRPMSRVAFSQLIAGVGLPPGRYSAQRVRLLVDQALKTGLIRRVVSKGGRGQASFYRLAFVDELLIEVRDDALLLRLQELDERRNGNLQQDLLQVTEPEKPAAETAVGLAGNLQQSEAETCSTFDPKPAPETAAHRSSRSSSKDRTDGGSQKRGDDDGRRTSLEAMRRAKGQVSARLGWTAEDEPPGPPSLEDDEVDGEQPLPMPDEAQRPLDDEAIEAEMVEVAS